MRESGILMPVSSLPGPYGIGCFGKAAFQFVDFLSAAGQTIWQLLPLSPTGYGDSPYQSCSAFAGNPYFVDLEALEKEGLLTAADLKAESWGKDPLEVDYGTLYVSRFAVLRKAYAAWRSQCAGLHGCSYYYPDDYYAFTLANEDWLEDYALYMALKVANKMKNWVEWDAPYRRRDKAVLAAFAAANEEEIGFWKFVQYKFSVQWQAVKTYANKKGVQILGDIPIYVSADSVDAWVGGKLFELDADGRFARVAGCPPDYFSADGQLWGNPLYDWAYHKKTGYAWWIQRVRHALGIYDLLRIDHFRGFDTYWAIPATSTTARTGKWENGASEKEKATAAAYLHLTSCKPTAKEVAAVKTAAARTALLRAALGSVADRAIIPMYDWLGLGAEAHLNTPGKLGGNWAWRAKAGFDSKTLAAQIKAECAVYCRCNADVQNVKELAI